MITSYDYRCRNCGRVFEKGMDTNKIIEVQCPGCGTVDVKRIYTAMNFKLIYNNKKDMCAGGDNNYETSQYGRQVNEAREKGENVKGLGED